MENKNESDSKDKIPWLPKLLKDGLNGVISDSLKAALVPIFTVIIISGLGFILYLNSIYIRINISFPAYQVGIAFLISIVIVYTNQKLIRKVYKRLKWHSAYGFFWKNNSKDELSGPHCQVCKAFVVEAKPTYERQIQGAYNMMQGIKVKHVYMCSNPKCTSSPVSIDEDMQALIQKVQSEFYSS